MKMTALILAVIVPCCFADAPIRTDGAARDVVLANGVSLRLEARSVGTIYADHAVLEQGAARVSHFGGYQVQAGDLLIESETPASQAVIRLEKDTVEVASLGGPVRVTDGGVMLTRVTAGSRVAFQATGAAPGAKKGPSETKVWVWVIVAISAAALAIGLTAVSEGKSPF
jgi:ferric-dicitrate binding protein FerR (iron transport regulator)